MALHLLNISVNTSDFTLNESVQDFRIEDEETLIEFIIENILGFEEAVNDSTVPESQQKTAKKSDFKSCFLKGSMQMDKIQVLALRSLTNLLNDLNQRTQKSLVSIDTPPPRI